MRCFSVYLQEFSKTGGHLTWKPKIVREFSNARKKLKNLATFVEYRVKEISENLATLEKHQGNVREFSNTQKK